MKRENTITAIHGFKGDGKTSVCTLFMYLEKLNRPWVKLYANYKLKFGDASFLHGQDMIENRTLFNDAVIAIDELHEYADSRDSGSAQNKRISDFFLQSRHGGTNGYITDQYKDQYDKRIRRICDYDAVVTNLYVDSDHDGDDDLFRVTIINRRRPDLGAVTRDIYLKPVFDLFDSEDRIDPFIYTKKDSEKWRNDIAKKANTKRSASLARSVA